MKNGNVIVDIDEIKVDDSSLILIQVMIIQQNQI